MQVVLLTGGAGGLARALADLVLTRGGRVWLCDLAAEAVTAAVATLRAKHAEAGLYPNCTFSMGCLQESLAVERYIANLAPKFATLTPQELDEYYQSYREELADAQKEIANAKMSLQSAQGVWDALQQKRKLQPRKNCFLDQSRQTLRERSFCRRAEAGFLPSWVVRCPPEVP